MQYDPPDDPREYIHRVGRTARGTAGIGRALLFLLPEEMTFLKYLRAVKVSLQEFEFPADKIKNIGQQMSNLIEQNFYLNKSARDAYRSYLLSYSSHSHKDIFNVHALDLVGCGRAFGFSVPPRVDLPLSARGDKSTVRHNSAKKRQRGSEGGGVTDHHGGKASKAAKFGSSGHSFSAENPYGKRDASDKRQFSH